MIAQPVELCGDRPALGQVPDVDKPAAGNEEDKWAFIRAGFLRWKPDKIYSFPRRDLLALFFVIKREVPLA